MRKSLVTIAVLGTLALPTAVFAADAAPAAAPAPAYTISYNVGLFSQYIFRGLPKQIKNQPCKAAWISLMPAVYMLVLGVLTSVG